MKTERLDKLNELGLLFNGSAFVYEDINFHWTDIVCMTDEEFLAAYEGAKERLEVLKSSYSTMGSVSGRFHSDRPNMSAEPKSIFADITEEHERWFPIVKVIFDNIAIISFEEALRDLAKWENEQ